MGQGNNEDKKNFGKSKVPLTSLILFGSWSHPRRILFSPTFPRNLAHKTWEREEAFTLLGWWGSEDCGWRWGDSG